MRILLTGATGLVGQGVLRECLSDPGVTRVVALGRRPSGQTHAKLEELVVADFNDLRAVENRLQPFDACLYCAGAPPIGTPEPNTGTSPSPSRPTWRKRSPASTRT